MSKPMGKMTELALGVGFLVVVGSAFIGITGLLLAAFLK